MNGLFERLRPISGRKAEERRAVPDVALYYGGAYFVFFGFKGRFICQVNGNHYRNRSFSRASMMDMAYAGIDGLHHSHYFVSFNHSKLRS